MNRRDLLAPGAALTLTGFPFRLASSLQASNERKRASDHATTRMRGFENPGLKLDSVPRRNHAIHLNVVAWSAILWRSG